MATENNAVQNIPSTEIPPWVVAVLGGEMQTRADARWIATGAYNAGFRGAKLAQEAHRALVEYAQSIADRRADDDLRY